MAYTTIDNSASHFNTVTYTGNVDHSSANGSQAITGVGFQPDWIWIKPYVLGYAAGSHNLTDSVRGAGKSLFADLTGAEYDYGTSANGGAVIAIGSDGFTLGGASQVNEDSNTYVAWNWLAGTSVSGSTGGSGTSKSYSGSVNTTSGFSIITYVGNGTAGHTVPHHLGAVPRMIIVKGRDQVENWTVYHEGLTSNNYALRLNDQAAQFSQTLSWNDTTPTSSVFTLGGGAGTSDYTNRDGINMIAYCFAEKKGYSKFGSYVGNGNADGTFVFCGFRPAWLMIKSASSASTSWVMHDNKRDTFNVAKNNLDADNDSAQASADRLDILSNGFKSRSTLNFNNKSGDTYIYMAFAESPFVNSNGVPNNAR
jgi:hypothetical protein|tara:strand:- start:158 stop:1258 length:1101 start_codon:yes stop_codon:yes gene_type:complete